jgi:DNA processing protein
MELDDKKYYFAFSLLPEIGPARLERLQNYFNTLAEAWQAPISLLLAAGLESSVAEKVAVRRAEINLEKEWENLERKKIKIVSKDEEAYPALLKEIHQPPYLLFYQGTLADPRDRFCVAVVGTRKISPYGQQATEKITADLTRAGTAIVSGLALGVDATAHETCLKEKGRTIAVVGSGLDRSVLYPPNNIYLAEKIIQEGGVIFSEYPPLTPPHKLFFPQRNRIISGLALGTLVVEAPLESGAMLTAKIALDQNRDVFAVPGSIFNENSLGPNQLLKLGAKAASDAGDILEALNLEKATDFVAAEQIVADTLEEKLILEILNYEPVHVDDLRRQTKLDSSLLSSTLTLMEMKGKARNMGAMRWVIGR